MIKLGTTTITNADGTLNEGVIEAVASQAAEVRIAHQADCAIVSSGAIGRGAELLGVDQLPDDVTLRQMCAIKGQPDLYQAWHEAFARHGIETFEYLPTHETFATGEQLAESLRAVNGLIVRGEVPIINENDAVSREELASPGLGRSFDDNDGLAALVSVALGADRLVMLTSDDTSRGIGRGGRAAKQMAIDVATHHGIEVGVTSNSQKAITGLYAESFSGNLYPPKLHSKPAA